jgi:hypothetical protein
MPFAVTIAAWLTSRIVLAQEDNASFMFMVLGALTALAYQRKVRNEQMAHMLGLFPPQSDIIPVVIRPATSQYRRMTIQIRTSLAEPETGQSFIPHRPARPEKVEGGRLFKLVSEYHPSGDQPHAIEELVEAAQCGREGSGAARASPDRARPSRWRR